VACTVCDPILVGESSRRVNNELLSLLVIGRSGLHLNGIVAVAQLGEAEAAHVREAVHFISHELLVPVSVHRNEGTTEKIELNGEFDGERPVHVG